jgi:hypothetical protein
MDGVDTLTLRLGKYVARRIESLELLSKAIVDASRQRVAFEKLVAHLRALYIETKSDFPSESIQRIKSLVSLFDEARIIDSSDLEFKRGNFYFIDDRIEEVTDASRGLKILGGCYRSADLKDAAWKVHRYTVLKIQDLISEVIEESLTAPSELMDGIISEVRSLVFVRYCYSVKSRGKTPGELMPSTKKIRVTHCFACKSHLDSRLQLECSECGWIVCQCGACECSKDL